jgi:hypothetical protein
MMILLRRLGFTLIGCLCMVGTAGAAQTAKLKVAFVPDRAGARTTLELALRISGPHGALPEPMTSLALRLPAAMGIASTTLGQSNCYRADLLAAGLNGCSPNARIGFGTATAVVPVGPQIVTEKASLDALKGEPGVNRIEILFYVQANEPVVAGLVFPSVVEEASPPYGEELATSVPLVQAWPEGPHLALETFNSTVGPLGLTYYDHIKGRTIAYKPKGLRIPQACPAGGYAFSAILNFQDGSHSTANYRVPCPPH